MKKHIKNILFSAALFLSLANLHAQTQGDTVKTGKSNDPMSVKPAKPNDPMTVKPGKPNDSMSVKPAKPNDANAVLTDTGFISKNINDNLMEIELSKIGRNKGTGTEVKQIAEQMIEDHTAMLNDLKKLAASKGVGLSGNNHSSPNLPQAQMKPSKDFNKAWASQMLTMHEDKIAELESFMAATQDAEIKAVITKALPKIKMHRDKLAQIPGANSGAGKTVI